MKKVLVSIFIISIVVGLSAESWTKSADVSLNLNQNSYSDNWAGSEIGSISWAFNANLLAEKQLSAELHDKNTLKLAFGQTHSQFIDEVSGDKKWAKPDKTTDLIDFESLFRFTLGLAVDPFASVRWESQFMDEREDEVKSINPNIFTETFGVAKVFIKEENKELSTRFGAAFKQYFDSYADDSTNDGGLEFVGEFKTPLAKNVFNYNTKLTLYKALYFSESDAVEDTPFEDAWQAVRMDWEHILTAQLTTLLNMNLYFQLIYDETAVNVDGSPLDEIQFKETLGLGFTYKLF